MSEVQITETAERMIANHGGHTAARDWAELHACANIGRNKDAVDYWDKVSKEIMRLFAQYKKARS